MICFNHLWLEEKNIFALFYLLQQPLATDVYSYTKVNPVSMLSLFTFKMRLFLHTSIVVSAPYIN